MRVGVLPARVMLTLGCVLWGVHASAERVCGQASKPSVGREAASPTDLLSPKQWRDLNHCIERALAWLVTQQRPDGQIRGHDIGQPAVSSLAVLAFLSCGHSPGEGPYGETIDRAIDYVIRCQRPDGLLSHQPVRRAMTSAGSQEHTASYNHAIAGLMLAEAFGTTGGERNTRLGETIEDALGYTLRLQQKPKRDVRDRGGWRYIHRWAGSDSDLSLTSWHLMFLRSARNAGFAIPVEAVDEALAYVERLAQPDGSFRYGLDPADRHVTPAMVGAGVVSLSLAGRHHTPVAQASGKQILGYQLHRKFGEYRYFYNVFYCTQAMHQLGGDYWSGFYPAICDTLCRHQRPDGSWPPEPGEIHWGPALTTALSVLVLSTPYELLPIFQR